MGIDVKIFLKAAGVFALTIIGAGLYAAGAILENDGVTEAGKILLGVGIFVIIILGILSYLQKKNYFK